MKLLTRIHSIIRFSATRVGRYPIVLAAGLASLLFFFVCMPRASLAAGPEALMYRGKSQEFTSIQQLTLSMGQRENGGGANGKIITKGALEPIDIQFNRAGDIALKELPVFSSEFSGYFAGLTREGGVVLYSLDPDLQNFV